MSLPDNYYLFGRKPLQYAVIDPVSCTGCGWCAMFCPVECMFQRPDGFALLDLGISVSGREQLKTVTSRLEQIQGVMKVTRPAG